MSASLAGWQTVPKELFLHQIFSATFRYLSAPKAHYNLFNLKGLKVVYDQTPIKRDDLYTYKTVYFKVLSPEAALPGVAITTSSGTFKIVPYPLTIKQLHPPTDFCGVLAKKFHIQKYQAIQYNKNNNLVMLKIEVLEGNAEDFHLPFALKEEIKESNLTFPSLTILYYAIVPASLSQLRFSYFDTTTREFKKLFFDIKVKDESVSTQSDIRPAEDKNKVVKITLFSALGVLALLWAFWKRGLFLALLGIASLGYAIYLSIPLQKVCVKQGTKIYILPTKNSTIFRINEHQKEYTKLNEVGEYIKIKLSQDRIGWIKNEDICKN